MKMNVANLSLHELLATKFISISVSVKDFVTQLSQGRRHLVLLNFQNVEPDEIV